MNDKIIISDLQKREEKLIKKIKEYELKYLEFTKNQNNCEFQSKNNYILIQDNKNGSEIQINEQSFEIESNPKNISNIRFKPSLGFSKIIYSNISSKINPLSKDHPILIGLDNVGGINYMNSIIQCFSQTEILTNYFLEESNKIEQYDEDEYELTKSYLKIIEKLWLTNKNIQFNPYNFRNVIISKNKSFKDSNSEKIKDFINFILEQLHNELKNKNIENDLDQNKSLDLNANDKEIMLKNFNEKINKEKTIISELFFGTIETSYECLHCNNNIIYYNYEILKYITFPLEEIKSKINSNNNEVTIDDCLNIISEKNLFNGEKEYYCYKCKKLTKCKYQSNIYEFPNILIIILERDKNNIFPVKINFNDIFNITRLSKNNDISQIFYELYGVVTLTNQNEQKENFVAFCKSPINNKWYKFDDTKVSNSISDIKKNIINYKIPYILFYKKQI